MGLCKGISTPCEPWQIYVHPWTSDYYEISITRNAILSEFLHPEAHVKSSESNAPEKESFKNIIKGFSQRASAPLIRRL